MLYSETSVAGQSLFQFKQERVMEPRLRGGNWGEVLPSPEPALPSLSRVEQAIPKQGDAVAYGTSFPTAPAGEKKTAFAEIPDLEDIDLHNAAVTSKVRNLLRNFWAVVVSKSLQASFPIERTVTAVFSDPAEDRHQVVLRVFTEASAVQAVAFWEGLENDLQEWITRLDERDRLIFLRDISLRIHWR